MFWLVCKYPSQLLTVCVEEAVIPDFEFLLDSADVHASLGNQRWVGKGRFLVLDINCKWVKYGGYLFILARSRGLGFCIVNPC